MACLAIDTVKSRILVLLFLVVLPGFSDCFAEGVGLLLGAIISSIGIHGICMLRQKTLDGN
ncbi:MAG: hypothetical protein EAZ09_20525 [Oscillatoriales cyanobacterium]|nr:MAG: hypothetical protein EAZ09_20525 [Oscillatoriales cyanobacterium]